MRKQFSSLHKLNILQIFENNFLKVFPLDKKLISFNDSFCKTNQINFNDDILNFFYINSENPIFIIVGKSNKKISIYNNKNEVIKEFTHYKKITSIILINQDQKYFLI